MEKAKVVLATQELVDSLKGRFRKSDADEVYAMSGRVIDKAVDDWNKSELCWVGIWEDDPVTVFGVRRVSMLSDEGTPWLLGTDRIFEKAIKRRFIELSIPYVYLEMLRRFDYLENFVDARNLKSIRWLKMIGFTVEEAKPMGHLNVPFHRFWLRR